MTFIDELARLSKVDDELRSRLTQVQASLDGAKLQHQVELERVRKQRNEYKSERDKLNQTNKRLIEQMAENGKTITALRTQVPPKPTPEVVSVTELLNLATALRHYPDPLSSNQPGEFYTKNWKGGLRTRTIQRSEVSFMREGLRVSVSGWRVGDWLIVSDEVARLFNGMNPNNH